MQTIKGRTKQPPRIIVSGPNSVGKSTFASKFPTPIALDLEGGLEEIGVERLPRPETYVEVKEQLAWVASKSYKTLIIDSIDWLEKLIQSDIAAQAGVADIARIPWGEGYRRAYFELARFLGELDELRKTKRMIIVMTAHVRITKFTDPLGDNYDKYTLNMHESEKASTSQLVRDWCDCLLFAEKEKLVRTEKGGTRGKAKTVDRHIVHTRLSHAYEAKNRYDLPAVMDLDFGQVWGAILAFLNGPVAKPTEPETKLELVEEVNV